VFDGRHMKVDELGQHFLNKQHCHFNTRTMSSLQFEVASTIMCSLGYIHYW